MPRPEVLGKALRKRCRVVLAEAELAGDRRDYQGRVAEWCQIDERDAIGEVALHRAMPTAMARRVFPTPPGPSERQKLSVATAEPAPRRPPRRRRGRRAS